jgi:hypothetical protein
MSARWLRDPLKWGLPIGAGVPACIEIGAHVQFEYVRDHDHVLRPVPILEHCEFQCFSTVNKETAAKTAFVLDDPTAVTVFANQKKG